MSNSKKKNYKKRKQAAHTKAKTPRNVKPEQTKWQKFIDNWLWLITFIIIVILTVVLVITIPKCDASGACDSCVRNSNVEEGGDTGELVSTTDLNTLPNAAAIADTAATPRTLYPDAEQFKLPAAGEEIAVLETNVGTIKLRLFPEAAPKAVENFKGLVSSGYYNGVTFHRVMDNFMIQSGDPTGTGSGGESIWGADFEDEFGKGLYNFRGALSMANTGADNSNSSQFFIVQAPSSSYDAASIAGMGLPQNVADMYTALGGACWLDGEIKSVTKSGHTVFGQVIEGMNVVDAIAGVAVNDAKKPNIDIIINNAYLTPYAAE